MAINLNEKILFQRARSSQGIKVKSNPYRVLKSAERLKDKDKRGVLVIDPNKVIDQYGNIVDRYVKQENLTMYAGLKVIKNAETAIISHSGGKDNEGKEQEPIVSSQNTSEPIYVNFLNPLKNKKRPDGTYERKGKFTTEWTDFFTSDDANNKTKEGYIIDSETFGLSDITITVNASYLPIIKITFIDVQGRMLFERGNDENSPYNIFFTYPYPKFYLTYKGYYGRATELPMYLLKSNTRFDPQTGDYHITAEFQSEMFGLFNTFLIIYAYAAAYMFMSDSGEYLGKKILRKLYEEQNLKIKKFLDDNERSTQYSKYFIDPNESPSLYDLSKAVKKIPSSAFDVGNDDFGQKEEQLLKIKTNIETYQKSVNVYFNNDLNYKLIENNINNATLNNATQRTIDFNIKYHPLKEETKFTSLNQPVEIYNAIEELNKLYKQVKDIDLFVQNSPNLKTYNKEYKSLSSELNTFIDKDKFITNRKYKNNVNNTPDIIFQDTMFSYDGDIDYNATKENQILVINNFDRVIVELLNQISYLQNILENQYLDNEVRELSTYLGYEPNLNNVLRIISNNMQTFLILMELMAKNGLKQIQFDSKRRRILESKTNHISKPGDKTKQFTAFPNYYKTTKFTLNDGQIVDRKILAYPGVDGSNYNWFEVLFIEEIFKSLKYIRDISSTTKKSALEQKFTSILTVFGLGDLDLDVYKNKNNVTKLLGESLSKYLLYYNYSGLIYRGSDDIGNVGSYLADFEIEVLKKTIFSPTAVDDNSRLKLDIFNYTKKNDADQTGIKNSKSDFENIKYTRLGNLAINGINVVKNGTGTEKAKITAENTESFGTISIYSQIKKFADTEIELYDKQYTQNELSSVIEQRKKYVSDSISDKLLYEIITFDKVPNPLKYSILNYGGKLKNITPYPDFRNNTVYYSDIKPEILNTINDKTTQTKDVDFNKNFYQGFYKNLNETLKNVKINGDTTKSLAIGKSTAPALTQGTSVDEISGDNQLLNSVKKPNTKFLKIYKDL